ncbi:MAG: FtsX-like permease family protein, partial [Longimicrobiales bacterium]
RTREIGIRLALGASPRGVLTAVFRRAATQLGTGIIAGNLLIALLMSTVGPGLWAGLVLPLAGISALMVLVGLLACIVPARRALTIQPTQALKQA